MLLLNDPPGVRSHGRAIGIQRHATGRPEILQRHVPASREVLPPEGDFGMANVEEAPLPSRQPRGMRLQTETANALDGRDADRLRTRLGPDRRVGQRGAAR